MNEPDIFQIRETKEFHKDLNRLVKKKDFRKLPKQIRELSQGLATGNFGGMLIKRVEKPVKYEEYKLRLPNEDTKSGKLNGYRVIYAVMTEKKVVLLITIYYKKEIETVPQEYIDGLVEMYFANKKE